jgi:hypothetical protein
MSSSVAAAGVQLYRSAEALLGRSAERFARAEVVPDAVVDVVEARLLGRTGTLLLGTARDMERHLLDVFV